MLMSLGACDSGVTPTGAVSAPVGSEILEGLRLRSAVHFEIADLLKPVSQESDFDPYLAPLFYREVEQTTPSSATRSSFGSLVLGETGLAADTGRPAVYFHESSLKWGASEYEQTVFLWFRPGEDEGPVRAQGLRATFDSQGFQCVFEPLSESSGASVFYVAKSLEAAALAKHGEPLAGRMHSIEPELEARPDVVVARVYGEGPMPMGPFVYVTDSGADVLSLHCRCSPSQMTTLREGADYELLPWDSLSLEVRTRWTDALEEAKRNSLGFEAPEWPFLSLRWPDSP